MDCQYAVKLIKSETQDRSPHAMIMQEVKRLLGEEIALLLTLVGIKILLVID